MKRWALRLFAAAALGAGIVAGLAFLTLRGSLPAIDGEYRAAGLDDAASIDRDAAGIPTVSAATRSDLAFATGFAHAQDRYFQMDTLRRRAAGELSEIFGAVTVDADRRARFHGFRALSREVLGRTTRAERSVLDHYAAGVNAGLESLAAKPFEYFLLGVEPEPWLPEDSLLVLYTMFMELNDSRATRDIRRGYARRVLPTDVYAWLYPQGTPWDAPLLGEPTQAAPIPDAGRFSIRSYSDPARPAEERGREPLHGSNNWAVGGRLTSSGRAIVANDMHLGLSTPNIYYRARLVLTGADPRSVAGVTLPGAPFIVAGSNGHIAWGYTNSYGDWSDAIVLKGGSEPGTYRTPSGDQDPLERIETIVVKGSEPVLLTVRETSWGPILETADYPDGEIAVSWTAHHPEAVNLRILDLESALSVAGALDVANTMGIPPQNFVVGDADGNIGWTIAGRIPRRSDYDPTVPADWSRSGGWSGWLDPAEYPRIVNPESGRIWTANARVVDGEALRLVGDGGYDLGARARQIRDALFARDRFEPGDMLAIQVDDRAVFLGRWRDLLLKVLDEETAGEDADLAEYRRLVAEWIPRATPESVGYRLVRAFRLEVQARVFNSLVAPVRAAYPHNIELVPGNQFEAPLWSLVTAQPAHLLPDNHASWQAMLLGAVRENIRYFNENFDGALRERSWGERNTARIRHPLSGVLPLFSGRLDMPAQPLGGDTDMPRAQGPNFGASERFAVAPGDEAHGVMHMPTGQSGHPLSEFYRHGHDDWVRGRPTPFLPGPAQHTLLLLPSGT